MPYHSRRWNVEDVGLDDMADCISNSCFVLCQGFRCDGILWLHDSAAEGDIQEWAVIREKDGRQCESVTIGWTTAKEAKEAIREYHQKYANGAKPMFGEGQVLQAGELDHQDDCGFCA